MLFMVLSSWHFHCKSLPSLSDKCSFTVSDLLLCATVPSNSLESQSVTDVAVRLSTYAVSLSKKPTLASWEFRWAANAC